MKYPEARDMLVLSIAEIQRLRSQLAELVPRAQAYEAIVKILGLLPSPSQGYEEDLVWRLQRELKKIDEETSDQKKGE